MTIIVVMLMTMIVVILMMMMVMWGVFRSPKNGLRNQTLGCCSVSGSFFVNICVTLSDMKLLDGIIDLFWPADDHLQSRFLWSHWGEAADRTVRSSDGSSNILSDHLIIWSSDILSQFHSDQLWFVEQIHWSWEMVSCTDKRKKLQLWSCQILCDPPVFANKTF